MNHTKLLVAALLLIAIGIGVVVLLQKNREDVAPQQEINDVEVLEAETPAELPPKEPAPKRKKVSEQDMKDQALKAHTARLERETVPTKEELWQREFQKLKELDFTTLYLSLIHI